ncbi:hypothetical protein BROUX41_003601 [Berkeleyomyces rouxiae]|uniref:uncharacterized protein n=1 Tax=Berkeleyomyces rouxiae TaxID=2035830 RepID=UPI003B777961
MKNWLMGKEAFEATMPHHEGMKALWETKWKEVCLKAVYPFHEGKYEDFEPVFQYLIDNNINDGYSPEYTRAFLPGAERLEREADALRATDPEAASNLYLRACAMLRIARMPHLTSFPEPSCEHKFAVFQKQKAVYLKANALWDRPFEDVRVPHVLAAANDRKEIPVYVRTPAAADTQPVPTVILMMGLDLYRPDNTGRSNKMLERGWAVIVAETPGTGECPADVQDPTSPDRLWTSLLMWMEKDGRFDMSRLVVWGGSAGGYYAIRIAHTHRDRLLGSVAHGAGCHYFYDPEWAERADGHEFPFPLAPAMVRKHGFKDVDEYKANVQKKYSLLEHGILHQESTRLLLVNGTMDGLVPIEDATMLFEYGSPKEARLIPGRVHMGYPEANKYIFPWIEQVIQSETLQVA